MFRKSGRGLLSETISSGPAPDGSPATAQSVLSLYAASARNILPRVVSSATVVLVASCYLGLAWALVWGATVWAGLVLGLWLTPAVARHSDNRWFAIAPAIHGVVSGLIQAVMVVALWREGDALPTAFAAVTLFIGATYVLLQYYSEPQLFRVLMSPYAAATTYMAWDLGQAAGWRLAAMITVAAVVISLGNFFRLSRIMLDRSRTALRQARKRAQAGELAAGAANAAKSTFLATMSHEIRTPLNGVLGMAQAMAGDELSERQRERLSVIHSSGEALLAILNDVLDLSKIEAGRLEMESVEFDLGEVARGAYSAFTALANKKGLSFALDMDGARGRYLGDPTRLRQILYNLISNALKFTEQGEIRVTARRSAAGLDIVVRDTGVGIAPESLARLFAKFDQLDSSTTRRFGGTGLGLAICRELAQLMAGEISVESELGLGSAFTVHLPLPWVGEEKTATAAGVRPQAGAGWSDVPLRVLAAEDNAINQLVLKTLLHQMGVTPLVVDNGADAVAAWEDGAWDVILMDIQMPLMDGLTATAQIRTGERMTGRPRTPIVALTANAMAHQVELYIAGGMDGHVAKPIQAAELYEALRVAVAQSDDGAEGSVTAVA
jgi:signal transduction histidine kinase/ActR/RegA family two-component response regulator